MDFTLEIVYLVVIPDSDGGSAVGNLSCGWRFQILCSSSSGMTRFQELVTRRLWMESYWASLRHSRKRRRRACVLGISIRCWRFQILRSSVLEWRFEGLVNFMTMNGKLLSKFSRHSKKRRRSVVGIFTSCWRFQILRLQFWMTRLRTSELTLRMESYWASFHVIPESDVKERVGIFTSCWDSRYLVPQFWMTRLE